MTKEQFINAMGDIDDKFIKKTYTDNAPGELPEFDPNDERPQVVRPTSGHSNIWKFAVSAAAVVVMAAGIFAVLKLNGLPSVDPGGVVISEDSQGNSTAEEPSNDGASDHSSETGAQSSFDPDAAASRDNYRMEHLYDKVVKGRYVYGETEIPDIHYENANEEGCVTHSIWGSDWEYIGLESMELESHSVGDYTIKLVGNYVRTDKEHFPGRIYAESLIVEVEKDGVKLANGAYTHPWIDIGPQNYPEYTILTDKIGEYLDLYEMENPVVAMRYYYNNDAMWEKDRTVDFGVVMNGECFTGFCGICEPGCGRICVIDSQNPRQILNEKFTRCRGAVFEADKFKIIDKNTLYDEKAGITYTFKFADPPKTVLYTTEKNVGSVAAAPKEDWQESPYV